MELTLKVPDRIIKQAAASVIDDCLFHNYDDSFLKTAKVPSKTVVLKEYMADAKFVKKLEAELKGFAQEKIDDYLYDILSNIRNETVEYYMEECDKAYIVAQKVSSKQRELDRQAEELERAKTILTNAGYTVEEKNCP